MDIFVARQPILDRDNKVVAYELLYRNNERNAYDPTVSSNVATSILLMNSFLNLGIQKLVGDCKAFINFDKYLIEAEIPKLVDNNKIVVEMLEDIVPDENFMKKVIDLKHNGYTIAIDDLVEDFKHINMIESASILKVDFFENTKEQIEKIVKKWKPKGKVLLAEKVETDEEYIWAKKLGFDLFQGYYFSKPSMIKGKDVGESQYQFIKIMEELSRKEPDYKKIATTIESDLSLTYKLLRLVNSNFTETKYISSIQYGLSIIGIQAFEKWFTLAMVKTMSSDKPAEITKMSMLRGKFLERLAENGKHKNSLNEIMFIGILSVIDGLLEKPMDEIVNELPLDSRIKNALLLIDDEFTDYYRLLLAFEKGEFDKISIYSETLNLEISNITSLYVDSVTWAEELYSTMSEAG